MDFYDIKKLNPDQTTRAIIFDDFEIKLYSRGRITLEEFNQVMKEKEEYAKQLCDTMYKSLNSCINTVLLGQQGDDKNRLFKCYKQRLKEKKNDEKTLFVEYTEK